MMINNPQPTDSPAQVAGLHRPGGFHWKRIAAVALAIVITVAIALLANRFEDLEALGYAGAFLIMLFGNATVILPVPGLVFVIAMGSTLNPWLLGLAAGPGAALGELTGYLAGYGGATPVENTRLYRRFDRLMDRYGLLVVFALSIIPNPIFDLAGVLAGASHIPMWQFLLTAALGKTIQATVLAWAGALSLDWLTGFFI
jgi:uncharacterized membrane protein YdjX (TVP38/TMEM64 family)